MVLKSLKTPLRNIKIVLNEMNGNEMNANEIIGIGNEIFEKLRNLMILGNPLDPQCRGDVGRRLLNPRLPGRGRTAQERT